MRCAQAARLDASAALVGPLLIANHARGWVGAPLINFGISQVIWFTLARKFTPQASTFSMMVVPWVSVASAVLILDERPQASAASAAAFIVAAIAVVHGGARRASA